MIRLLRSLLLAFALVLPATPVRADAPAILLAEVYRNQVDVGQYLVSEKLDGVRGIWDGQTLRFRSGKTINAPVWFLDGLPKRPPSSACPASCARKCPTTPNGGRCAT